MKENGQIQNTIEADLEDEDAETESSAPVVQSGQNTPLVRE